MSPNCVLFSHRINCDWAKRMKGKIKPKPEKRRIKSPEERPAQPYKSKQTTPNKSSEFTDRIQDTINDLKDKVTKRNKLNLLWKLNETQFECMAWVKSWEFCKRMHLEQRHRALDWGQSWKLLNLQPDDNKSWMEHENDVHIDATPSATNFLRVKLNQSLLCQQTEQDILMSDWEKSWYASTQKNKMNAMPGKELW